MKSLAEAQIVTWPYRVVPGEVIEIAMPAILRVVTDEGPDTSAEITPFVSRLSKTGSIVLPVVGKLMVAGQSLAEIESTVANAYYPTYIKTLPSVFVRILEYRTSRVSITGAVNSPGMFELRGDQMSLVTLLMTAGGVVNEGAAVIRIERSHRNTTPPVTVRPKLPPAVETPRTWMNEGKAKTRTFSLPAIADARGLSPELSQDVKLVFLPQGQSGLQGHLNIERMGAVLLHDDLNLASEAERFAILNRAVQIDPALPLADLNDGLCLLADQLNRGGPSQPGSRVQLISRELVRTGPDSIHSSEISRNLPLPQMASPNTPSSHDTIVLPVKGLNIPFQDVALQAGDIVVVERLVPPLFSVIGLVRSEGNFEYPPERQFNLSQAIAFAGGLDEQSDPHYAVIYRLRSDGTIAHMPFDIRTPKHGIPAASPMNVEIYPGDIIAIEKTPRTRATAFLKGIFHFQVGAFIPLF